ncbi:hypothetical protein VT84_19680 [Gemmata sp. SH-PL17]|uniref:DUF1570 domain-containing protein n=1 Tax=Gemmata sp. SH-PL17 TaxID=1630693 RepID=UPI0004B01E3D|nr:DUF1570 domain-containing protein [Gemmata sp. SH-PL17]AMV26629.1 hypothetical protein VT84_19680 [Gemmata sp. SH-PL17]
MRCALLALSIVLACAIAVAQPPAQPAGLSNWSFDEITLTNGAKLQGLILHELPDGIEFQSVSRPPGRPTVTLTSFLTKAEIAGTKKLSDKDRETLKEKLAELDPSGEGERKRMESLELVPTDWPEKPGGAKMYDSDYFTLVCTGTEELTRRSAVRLEQIYTAFTRFLPPTVKNGRPTKIMLATDPGEYKALLGGARVLNPAVFDVTNNRILCGSDLTRLGTDLQSARVHHAQQLAGLDRYEDGVRKLYKGEELARHLKTISAEKKRVYAADVNNGLKFDTATGKLLFALLYHESFHAYVATFVYPPLKPEEVKEGKGTGELPRWLNEGLAQVFETAVVEAGELRADHPDKERLQRTKDWLKLKNGNALVPLGDLLATGRDAFIASHADQKVASDRAYLSCWALAHYLTFDRKLIGTQEFNKYLTALNSGGDPKKTFAALVEKDLTAFEKDWHTYLSRLQTNGTLAK